ncbi:MAG: PQQ-binding-like beta-propeller repeat protein [Rhodococcus sp. (in: high G+C Gram-positive bacteria)]|nr:PQQ-binding-like beta-propeller repeat protein [Rhodococcus sp. (in: high G+C Gram-positive bacteria)]MDI6627696.1 PQQ-binding-like beta-propeller repeat protein [Rhodococcus sp. (in: high G+C Gram-positive bacteria)]
MTRRLQISAAAVLVAALVCASCATEERTPGAPIDGATGSAPGLGWTLTPSDAGIEGGQFRDPVQGSDTDSMHSGSISDGSTVVTLVGRLDGREFVDATLVGASIADGSVRWRAPADDIVGCGEEFVDGQVVCYRGNTGTTSEILTVDTESGESSTRDAAFPITSLTTADGHVYTSRAVRDGARATVSRGTADALDADWSVQFDSTASPDAPFASTLHTENEIGLFDDGRGVFAFDLDTGDNLWSRAVPDCARSGVASRDGAVRVARADCSDPNAIVGSEIVDTDGTVLAATDSVTLQQPTFDSPAEPSPLLLGTGGYRPSNPDPVWTDESLVWAVPSDITGPAAAFLSTNGLAYAVTGSVALLRNTDTATESAIDLDTGTTLWSRESGAFAEVGALDGDVATLFGPEVLRGIDVRTGSTVWDIPVATFDDEGIDRQSWPMFDRVEADSIDTDSIYTDSIYTRALSISLLRAR